MPRSCYEWFTAGHTVTGKYLIDPDGLEGQAPFNAQCVMDEHNGPLTVVHHNQEERTRVVGFEAPGSFIVDVKYEGKVT